MRTNNSLVVSSLMALAGVTLAAPVPQTPGTPTLNVEQPLRRWEIPPNLLPSNLPTSITLPNSVTFDPNINTGTQTETTTTYNNGNGDGNSGGQNTVSQNSNNGSGNKSQRRRRQAVVDNELINNGDGDNNGGSSSVTVNKGDGNGSHNTDSHNTVDNHDTSDSHNNQIATSIDVPIFKARDTLINNGDGDNNSGSSSVTVNKGDGNNSHNTDSHTTQDSHNSQDSHNNQVSTSIEVPVFKRTTVVNNGDGDNNSGSSSVSLNKDVGNDAYNTDSHNTQDSHNSQDSHNNQVSTSAEIPIFKRTTVVNNGDGDQNSGSSSVSLNKDVGNDAYNTDSHDTTDSHNTQDSHNNKVDTSIEVPVFKRATAGQNGADTKPASESWGQWINSHQGIELPYANSDIPNGGNVE